MEDWVPRNTGGLPCRGCGRYGLMAMYYFMDGTGPYCYGCYQARYEPKHQQWIVNKADTKEDEDE